jgi:hypothetical protein
MTERKRFEMTEEDFKKILEASKPVPYLVVGGHEPLSPQENANRAWQELGERLGFDGMTAEPIDPRKPRIFTAIPITRN